jgi:ubiquinol-cytochrome c reductase cytochrome c1 subunit
MWGSSVMEMGWMRKLAAGAVAAAILAAGGGAAWSAGEAAKPEKQEWAHHGVFGAFDRAAAQRGFQVYKEVCSSCHSMSLMSYRVLADIGYSEEQIKAIAAQYEVQDGPNDDGEMFTRPARPSDRFKAPFANEKAARAANGGAYPPDLSLIVKARENHEDYIYAILTHYQDPPAGHELPEGKYYNPYFPGGAIAMPPPISDGGVTYQDGTQATVQQQAHDVTTFLAFASEPKLEARHTMGFSVVSFLVIFTGVLFLAYKRVWRNVH